MDTENKKMETADHNVGDMTVVVESVFADEDRENRRKKLKDIYIQMLSRDKMES